MKAEVFKARRARLAEALPGQLIMLHSGKRQYRNLRSSSYPFRCSSHFLYCCGVFPPNTVILFDGAKSVLFVQPRRMLDNIWQGPQPPFEELATRCAADEVRALEDLPSLLQSIGRGKILTLPSFNPRVNLQLEQLLGRKPELEGVDSPLVLAMIQQRVCHDLPAQLEIARAADVAVSAIGRAMRYTCPGQREYQVQAEIEAEFLHQGMQPAFSSIVTCHGEILHNELCTNLLGDGDLLLADVGPETEEGYGADITRTWPVNGKFSPLQKDVYQVVLAMQLAAIAKVKPGVRFLDVHLTTWSVLAQGLVDLGLFSCSPDELMEKGIPALFFPHGVGHLLGLDPHDMEDLGDLAGYPAGRFRSTQFGLDALRLDRDLQPGMVVTIEPGFYWIPALFENEETLALVKASLSEKRLRELKAVRGIRIEDDLLVTADGSKVITAAAVKDVAGIEQLCQERL